MRRLGVAVAIAAALAGGAAERARAMLQRPGASCPDVTFIGARASGERWETHGGLGPAVEHLAGELGAPIRRAGLTFGVVAVRYPAAPTRDLYLPWRGRVGTYFRSIARGVGAAAEAARAAVRRCPGTRLVLAGYSQGAMVVHQAERGLSAAVLARVAATVLVGDGDRPAATRAVRFGSAPASAQGIRAALLPWTRREVAVPSRTAEVCIAGDLICDFAGRRLLGPAALRRAIAAHRAYAAPRPGGRFRFSPLLARAARWAVGMTVSERVPARGPTAVLTGVGQPFAGWRRATGEPLTIGEALPARLGSDRCLVLLLRGGFTAAQTRSIGGYLRAGGTVIGVGERGDDGRFTAADAALDALAGRLGVALAAGSDARDPGTTVTDRIATELAGEGVRRLGYDWATSVRAGPGARVLAWSADGATPLLAVQDVGRGRFVLAGDSDLVTGGAGDAFGRGDNGRLARALCP